jgi:5-methylcytosine-specific restriction enzyme B
VFSMSQQFKPIQKIIFGSPGTGKSYKVKQIAQDKLSITLDENTEMLKNTVKTVFHPEYTYADFMGKLLPLTQGNSVIYKFYPGHFLRILGMTYQSILEGKQENFLLVIDELNRGNAAAIFGTVFQLLDRESDGWSSYEVDISEMELSGIFGVMQLKPNVDFNGIIRVNGSDGMLPYEEFFEKKLDNIKKIDNDFNKIKVSTLLKECRISIPYNLSIIATINTSDESIYYLDTAFKRRWDWQYVKAPIGTFSPSDVPEELRDLCLFINGQQKEIWSNYVVGINEFIKEQYQTIRRIEDKQIGWWFIKPEDDKVELEQVKDKLMFYLWDSVFARDKKPLEKLLTSGGEAVKLTQYSDFVELAEEFMGKIFQVGEKKFIPF